MQLWFLSWCIISPLCNIKTRLGNKCYFDPQVHSWCVREEDEQVGEDSQPFVSEMFMFVLFYHS